ncbi:hypothetical protein JTE90_018822 [Oedothorax gibbosus]|uniref:Uncharacterized protein n=1 Tax=Oedothorax gibbosus TaxID=931172 RepID=A0AAV6TG79_9ARAC|nr:hypothetical protein JTE90_018822 [Oedothorax gibbosus]
MVTYCLNRTNFPSSLGSRFGRFCCGGVEKEEEPVFDQPGFNYAGVDPWSYVGPVIEPQNGRLVFRRGCGLNRRMPFQPFPSSLRLLDPSSEHHSWSKPKDPPARPWIPGATRGLRRSPTSLCSEEVSGGIVTSRLRLPDYDSPITTTQVWIISRLLDLDYPITTISPNWSLSVPGYPGCDLFVDAGLRRVDSEANALVHIFK